MSACAEPYTADTLDAEAMRTRLRDMAGRGRPGGALRLAADLWVTHNWWARTALRDLDVPDAVRAEADALLKGAGCDVRTWELRERLAGLEPGESLTALVEGDGGQMELMAWTNVLGW